ncbi:MAG: SDR family NAD(P)-dependent oxidoreductase [Novosphingobium sp.]|nr:SDR family NAD(P)-dependent oxidoreductase [Novosphingobium sp.]
MGKVIVITGASSGLGRALARRFGADGDSVVLLGRRIEPLQAVADEIGDSALAVTCDIGDPDSVRAAFAAIAERHSQIDVLINNAATIDYALLGDASDAHIYQVVNTNMLGNLFCTRAAINAMGYGGHIINVSSESMEECYPHHTVYQATKGGIETVSKHLGIELRPKGIRVTVARAGPMMDENQKMQASPDVAAAFYQACIESGRDLAKQPVSHFQSVMWVFRSLVDMPADMHVDTVRFVARHPSEDAFQPY